jgi:hypothetical protein
MAKSDNEVAQTNGGTKAQTAPAPYLPFLSFKGAIEALEQGVPKKLDRTIWRTQSGIMQTQILMAFRFFEMVDEEDRPTGLLHLLVGDKESRPEALRTMIQSSYANLLKHDLTKMSPKMVEDEMEQYNVTGETKRKAVTFFLKAAKFADIPMHPLLSSQVRNTGPRKKRAAKRNIEGATFAVTPTATESGITARNTRSVELSSGGAVTLTLSYDPFSLSSEDRDFVFELIDKLRNYESSHRPADSDEEGEEQ